MRPSDRTIRDQLRREAADVPIPGDMWQNISRKLDEDASKKQQRWRWVLRGAQWRPAMVLAVAAGFFWFALIPALPNAENMNMPGANGTQQRQTLQKQRNVQQEIPSETGTRLNDSSQQGQTVATESPSNTPLYYPTLPQ